jgi:hypothetical protein
MATFYETIKLARTKRTDSEFPIPDMGEAKTR